MITDSNSLTSRRDFIKSSAILGGALMAPAILPGKAAAEDKAPLLKIGLIGCGGRGTGAAGQALKADQNVVLTALGDAFEDRLNIGLQALQHESPDKVKVDEAHRFVGLDAYQKVIDSGVDVVILATPPGFRPLHLKAAVDANKHVFCEKPVATDAPGIRSVLASVEEAKRKNLALVAGFCWRYNLAERALFERVLKGDIGDVLAFYGTYYTGPVKSMPPESERAPGMTDMQWQLRNWMNFYWLSGDSFVEQAVHAVDWMCWAMKDVPPLKAVAVGGRQIPALGGNIYDHFEVNYEYANDVRGFIGSRQQSGCLSDNTATIIGSKGVGREMGFRAMPYINLAGSKHKADASGKRVPDWKYSAPRPDMYQVEHNEMFASIRAGKPINNGVRLATSTLTAIMGRMAAYTGQEITWDMALNSQEKLVPDSLTWETPLTVAPMSRPGETKFV